MKVGYIQPYKIGTQTWMADNMYVTSYPSSVIGDNINDSSSGGVWALDTGKFSFPSDKDYGNAGIGTEVDKNSGYRKEFGNYYQWSAVMHGAASDSAVPGTTQGICPAGWHVPTDGDWKVLEGALGMSVADQDATGWRGTDEGTQLKAGGSSGFNAVLAGNRGSKQTPQDGFYGRGQVTGLWTATEDISGTAFYRFLFATKTDINRGTRKKNGGGSVRCLKN